MLIFSLKHIHSNPLYSEATLVLLYEFGKAYPVLKFRMQGITGSIREYPSRQILLQFLTLLFPQEVGSQQGHTVGAALPCRLHAGDRAPQAAAM